MIHKLKVIGGIEGGNVGFKMKTSKSYLVSKNVLPFANSPKFDYESYHKTFLISSVNNSMMVNYLFFLLNGYEIVHRKPHSKQTL